MEYLIRRSDGEWFDLRPDQYAAALRTSSMPSRPVEGWGNHRIEVRGVEISFSDEDPGIQVTFEGHLPEEVADAIVGEVLANITQVTGQRGRAIRIA